MRILRVHNRYQERGGEDVCFEAEGELLRSRGEDVRTLVVTNDEIPEHRSPMVSARLAMSTIWSTSGYKRITDAIEQHSPDVVHFDNTFPLLSPSVYAACQRKGLPVIQTLHNYRLMCPGTSFFRDGQVCEDCVGKLVPLPGIKHGCYRDSRGQTAVVASMLSVHRIRRTWNRDVDRYIAPTEFVRQKMIEGGLPAGKITVKSHFLVNDPGFADGDRTGFLFVGRVVDYKGVELLPQVSQLMSEPVPIRIIGDGPLATDIEKHAATDSALHYLGRQPQPTVSSEMKAAIALLVPSILYETFGLTIAEAYACGTPVIASRLGAMAELVKDGETGLLFDPGDASDLTAKMTWAYHHQDEMRRMGHNARREYEEKFTPERNYRLLMDIYREEIARTHHQETRDPVVKTMIQQGGLIP